MELQGKRGAGRFQWNTGGWFGSQLGGTLWLVLLGAMLWLQGKPVGAWVLTLGLAANAFGCLLWSRREKLAPYPAIQLLLASCAAAAGIAMWVTAQAGLGASDLGLPSSAWVVLVYPALMIWFHFLERSVDGVDPGPPSSS